MKVLVDGDIVAFRCAASVEKAIAESGPEAARGFSIARTETLMDDILGGLGASEFKVFLTGKDNFRKKIFPEYKANRKRPPPTFFKDCKEYLVSEFNAIVVDGIEADDAIGIEGTKGGKDVIIVSIDKDLLQIPGTHYNWVHKTFVTVNDVEAQYNFFKQVLTGDRGDNVFGIPKVGEVTATRILEPVSNDVVGMYRTVRNEYEKIGDLDRFMLNCSLLWILRKENEYWSPNWYEQEPEHRSESTPSTPVEQGQSTERG